MVGKAVEDLWSDCFQVSEGPFGLTVVVLQMGQDLSVCLFGGDRPHIGSVALAVPRPSLRDGVALSATASVLNVVGHKEDRLTQSAAEQLAAGLGKVVSVAAGVHYDDLDELGIEAVCRLAQEAVDRILALHRDGSADGSI
jgi:hypothetical protein